MERYIVDSLAGRQYSWYLFNETLKLGDSTIPLFTASFDRCFSISGIEPGLSDRIPEYETHICYDEKGATQENVNLKKSGPYFHLQCVGKWIVSGLYTSAHPVTYSLRGPYLGNIDMYAGLAAAQSGSVSRKIINLTLKLNQSSRDLHIKIVGIAGAVIKGSYDGLGTKEYADDLPFEIEIRVPVEFVPGFLGLGDYHTNFTRYISSLSSDA